MGMLVILLGVVGSCNYSYIDVAHKELLKMDHLHILVLLSLVKWYQYSQVHVLIKQQFRMDCNYNLALDMERP